MNVQKGKGFTLIEVLIALSILSIALTALLLTSMQTTQNLSYLEKKTAANYVAKNVVVKARAKLLEIPVAPENLEDKREFGPFEFLWRASLHPTENEYIYKLMVEVYDLQNKNVLDFTAFIRAEEAS